MKNRTLYTLLTVGLAMLLAAPAMAQDWKSRNRSKYRAHSRTRGGSANRAKPRNPRQQTTRSTATRNRPNARGGRIANTATRRRPNTRSGGIGRTASRARPSTRNRSMGRTATKVRPNTARSAKPAARSGRQVQFRLPRNYSGTKSLNPSAAKRLAKLRALKDKSRVSTKGVGKPYKQGSRFKQLLNATRGQSTTRGTATRNRPISRRGRLSDTATRQRPNTRKGGIGRTARNARPNARIGGIGRSASNVRPNTRVGGIGRTATTVRPKTVPGGLNPGKLAGAAKLAKGAGVSMLSNDLTGTDPIDLGIKAGGDLIFGTNNAQQTINKIPESFNKSLIKQSFTDPVGAGNRVKQDAVNTYNDVKNVVTDPVGAVGSLFGG